MGFFHSIVHYRQNQINKCRARADQINSLVDDSANLADLSEEQIKDILNESRSLVNCSDASLREDAVETLANALLSLQVNRQVARAMTLERSQKVEVPMRTLAAQADEIQGQPRADLRPEAVALLNFAESLGWFKRDHTYAA